LFLLDEVGTTRSIFKGTQGTGGGPEQRNWGGRMPFYARRLPKVFYDSGGPGLTSRAAGAIGAAEYKLLLAAATERRLVCVGTNANKFATGTPTPRMFEAVKKKRGRPLRIPAGHRAPQKICRGSGGGGGTSLGRPIAEGPQNRSMFTCGVKCFGVARNPSGYYSWAEKGGGGNRRGDWNTVGSHKKNRFKVIDGLIFSKAGSRFSRGFMCWAHF